MNMLRDDEDFRYRMVGDGGALLDGIMKIVVKRMGLAIRISDTPIYL